MFSLSRYVEFEEKKGALEYFGRVGTQNLGYTGALEYDSQICTQNVGKKGEL